jgi:hypothetical protein
VLWNCRVRSLVPLGAAGLSAQRRHVPFGLKRGVPVARPRGGWEARKRTFRKPKKHACKCGYTVQQTLCGGTYTLQVQQTLSQALFFFLFSPFRSAMELSSEESCPTRHGWTICPARERPFWIIRGACPLHDLEEVRKREENVRKKKKKQKKHLLVPSSATATA